MTPIVVPPSADPRCRAAHQRRRLAPIHAVPCSSPFPLHHPFPFSKTQISSLFSLARSLTPCKHMEARNWFSWVLFSNG
ncbi:hypothetical protein ACB092_03G107700 [Castanea dentata]